ncbi:heterokaryon incompatibility protein-domain-containing protein [Apiosordaria backusii]|uniref:Heterokaryon incompatibility protein-domain-containing protein n=1 Tax=Apiosordaria backusii TaxID=314023 RepID=A0AA40DSN6_9PEZI|nr:heterokaryon incompatibility protein-domain-containing protein [Apiosordaria backusii]
MYRNLSENEFRVVHLCPGEFDEEIRCVLEIRPANVKTRYEALSYQWGDDSDLKTIQIVHLDSPPVKTDAQSAHALLRIDPTLPRTLYALFAAYCILSVDDRLFMAGVLYWLWSRYISKIPAVIKEIVRTKLWSLAYGFHVEDATGFTFEEVKVTSSLHLALRYLRSRSKTRTLWIDAICINQEDEDEKQVQIQLMQVIYANAWRVVVWLGGYHGISEPGTCEEGSDCLHQRRIDATFAVFGSLNTLWRSWYYRLVGMKSILVEEAIPGLIDLDSRGWWERLWVIQEVVLATGPVQVQCGRHICEYRRFSHMRVQLLQRFAQEPGLPNAAATASNVLDVIESFRYKEDPAPTSQHLSWLIRWLHPTTDASDIEFTEQALASRLQSILLRTSGHFKCRDTQDRLYGVLGIAGGSAIGTDRALADVIQTMSSMEVTLQALTMQQYMWFKVSSIWIFIAVFTAWQMFYLFEARYWPICRPRFVISNHTEILDATMNSSKQAPTRAQFFTGLARYLITKTKTLSILDGACCGTGGDPDMPSWVPDWSRPIDYNSYDYSIKKGYKPPDQFFFSQDGETLILGGLPRGAVNVVRRLDESTPHHPGPLQRAFEGWLSLPMQGKKDMAVWFAFLLFFFQKMQPKKRAFLVRLIEFWFSTQQRQKRHCVEKLAFRLSVCFPGIQRALWNIIYLTSVFKLTAGEAKKIPHKTTLVYSFDRRAREMGVLMAGEAARGDQLVFVPGCYHHLVLRRQNINGGYVRCSLVGLVALGLPENERNPYTEAQWTQCEREGALRKYALT